jgi:hypothetical protein
MRLLVQYSLIDSEKCEIVLLKVSAIVPPT